MTSASCDLNYGMKDLLKLDICQTLDAGGEKAELKTKK